jgi:hypothetical protein
MIHKFWKVRLGTYFPVTINERSTRGSEVDDDSISYNLVRQKSDEAEEMIAKIWNVLSAFEEHIAAMISDTFLESSNDDALLAIPPLARLVDSMSGYIDCVLALDIVRMSKGLKSTCLNTPVVRSLTQF